MRQAGCMPESSKHGSWRDSRLSVGMPASEVCYALRVSICSGPKPSICEATASPRRLISEQHLRQVCFSAPAALSPASTLTGWGPFW